MAEEVRVGDIIRLASGVAVKVTFASDPDRLWCAVHAGGYWRVQRQRMERGVAYYYGGQRIPMKLSQADAEAVATILNMAPIGTVLRAQRVGVNAPTAAQSTSETRMS